MTIVGLHFPIWLTIWVSLAWWKRIRTPGNAARWPLNCKRKAFGFGALQHRDIRGRTNFSGGIIAAVRANRKGFHFDELQGEDGSLIILDLQHCILGFAWARNGLTADSELAQCIFDAQCLAHIQNIPWVMVGDWNLLPHQNPLLDPGTALVAATDEFGELLPTRWSNLDSTENCDA